MTNCQEHGNGNLIRPFETSLPLPEDSMPDLHKTNKSKRKTHLDNAQGIFEAFSHEILLQNVTMMNQTQSIK